MSAPVAARVLRHAARGAARGRQALRPTVQLFPRVSMIRYGIQAPPAFSSSSVRGYAGLMPDTEDPQPPAKNLEEHRVTQATELDDAEYQAISDEYMDAVHEKAEQIQEEREDVEVEYSAGVLSITLPPAGTYIINKQPPNKQIWLSSPTSGPKRYDWVLQGESMHQKEGGGSGDWIYLRDGSSLTELLRKELGIDVDMHGHEESMQASVDPTE